MKSSSQGGLVYSTEHGRMCPDCRQPEAQCICKPAQPTGFADGVIRVMRETKGRKGKGVTLIKGAVMDAASLTTLARQLKAVCGSGGTIKDGVIEIQGDHVELVLAELKKRNLAAKRAG
ncbi:translation initiation factor Sui1 [Silvimonas iriomotensis]|uniref:Translation initiation factor n=1 Tax=Silvimonas iriomotensis TaxID=449662 RepID=A0ABQ2P667_9NEIS|nr:translation initiation factor Sui1 [Silvimonas iriomotensis]GGP19173.1 translation initiation factor [Silvimonas iriomotensis]